MEERPESSKHNETKRVRGAYAEEGVPEEIERQAGSGEEEEGHLPRSREGRGGRCGGGLGAEERREEEQEGEQRGEAEAEADARAAAGREGHRRPRRGRPLRRRHQRRARGWQRRRRGPRWHLKAEGRYRGGVAWRFG